MATTLIQHVGVFNSSSIVINGVTSGNVLIVAFADFDGVGAGVSHPVNTIVDNMSNTYLQVSGAQATETSTDRILSDLWYATNVTGGNLTLNITWTNGNPQTPVIYVLEFSGLKVVSPVYGGNAASGSASAIVGPNLTNSMSAADTLLTILTPRTFSENLSNPWITVTPVVGGNPIGYYTPGTIGTFHAVGDVNSNQSWCSSGLVLSAAPGIQNPDFENWNFGTSFVNPPNGTQIADNWHIQTFFEGDTITRESTIVEHGTYSLKWQTPSDSGSIYQPDIDVAIYAGQTITITGYVYSPDSTSFTIYVDDGTLHPGTSLSVLNAWEQLVVSYAVPASPVPIQVEIAKGIGGPTPVVYLDNFAIVSSLLTLNLSDSVSSSDSMTDSFSIPLSDSINSSDSAPQAFSVESSFLAPVVTPAVKTLTNKLLPANVKVYYEIQE